MGPGSDGPMGGMAGMEPHHMNGSLGKYQEGRFPSPTFLFEDSSSDEPFFSLSFLCGIKPWLALL